MCTHGETTTRVHNSPAKKYYDVSAIYADVIKNSHRRPSARSASVNPAVCRPWTSRRPVRRGGGGGGDVLATGHVGECRLLIRIRLYIFINCFFLSIFFFPTAVKRVGHGGGLAWNAVAKKKEKDRKREIKVNTKNVSISLGSVRTHRRRRSIPLPATKIARV